MRARSPDRNCDARHSAAPSESLTHRPSGGGVRIGRKRGGGPRWRVEFGNEHCRKAIRGAPRRFCRSERENVLGDMHLRRDPRRSAGHLCSDVGDSVGSPRRQPSAEQSPGRDLLRRSLRTPRGASPCPAKFSSCDGALHELGSDFYGAGWRNPTNARPSSVAAGVSTNCE
jgi:hypothetical protein